MEYKRHLVTAALPYANGPVHIGHLAGNFLPADVYVRYLRACKKDVIFVCGTDEHGVPITIRAMKEGTTPQAVVDRYHELISKSLAEMGIAFDIFSRTSTDTHKQTSQDFFKTLYQKNWFEEKTSEQYYDEEAKAFLADRYIIGTCPVCQNPDAYGDQCEKCGSTLSPDMLINPRSALSNSQPSKKPTKHWYFKLNEFEPFLNEWIVQSKQDSWKPNVYGQCKSWLDNGLQPRAMTRDGEWGVPVPLEGAEGKVMYVWFDAPIGYISATKELTPNWELYWKNEETKLVHFLGKDNIVFHCIIFPSMLKAHGDYILPDNVPANEFLNIEGQKVSTSRNWAVWVDDYIKDFPGQQDVLRYVLTANAPETKDNDFTWKDFQTRNNSELVAILGNFVNRTFVLMHKLCGGRVPYYHADLHNDQDKQVIQHIVDTKKHITESIEHYKMREAVAMVIDLARVGNKYMQDMAPWLLYKEAKQEGAAVELLQKRIDNCIHICLQLCANLAIYMNPFMPFTAKKLCHMLKVVDKMLDWENGGRMDLLKENYPLRAPELLFAKIEDETIKMQLDKLAAGAANAATNSEAKIKPTLPTVAPTITFDDFAKIDLRVGQILQAEKVEKADKLLKLEVDLGFEKRTIVSGIAMHYQPAELIGKKVIVVVNLAPRKMRGIESNGMLLLSENTDGRLLFACPDDQAENGAKIA